MGERCATPTDSIEREILTLKGSHSPSRFDPFRVRISLSIRSVGVAQRSPTAINLNPFGINTRNCQTDPLPVYECQYYLAGSAWVLLAVLLRKLLNSSRVGNPERAPKSLQPSAATAHPTFMLISISSPCNNP